MTAVRDEDRTVRCSPSRCAFFLIPPSLLLPSPPSLLFLRSSLLLTSLPSPCPYTFLLPSFSHPSGASPFLPFAFCLHLLANLPPLSPYLIAPPSPCALPFLLSLLLPLLPSFPLYILLSPFALFFCFLPIPALPPSPRCHTESSCAPWLSLPYLLFPSPPVPPLHSPMALPLLLLHILVLPEFFLHFTLFCFPLPLLPLAPLLSCWPVTLASVLLPLTHLLPLPPLPPTSLVYAPLPSSSLHLPFFRPCVLLLSLAMPCLSPNCIR